MKSELPAPSRPSGRSRTRGPHGPERTDSAPRRTDRGADRWSVWVGWVAPLAFLAWMALALYLTLVPGDDLVELARAGDPRLGHVLLFGGWTFLYGLLLMETLGRRSASVPWIVATGILFGALVELLQLGMPFGRTGSAADIGFDALGAAVAGVALGAYRQWRGWRESRGRRGLPG